MEKTDIATGGGDNTALVRELISALQAVRPGPGELTTFQRAIIEEHAELKRLLRGPALVSSGPVVLGFKPPRGKAGTTIEISGERLRDTTLVRIGAARITAFDACSDTLIKLKLPPTATTGEVTVFTPLGVAASAQPFVVTA